MLKIVILASLLLLNGCASIIIVSSNNATIGQETDSEFVTDLRKKRIEEKNRTIQEKGN